MAGTLGGFEAARWASRQRGLYQQTLIEQKDPRVAACARASIADSAVFQPSMIASQLAL